MMENRLKTIPLPIQLPLGKEDDFQGVIDLITMKAIIYDPHGFGTEYRTGRYSGRLPRGSFRFEEYLIEKLAERNDYLMEKFIDGQEFTEEEIREALRETTLQLKGTPYSVVRPSEIKGFNPARCYH